MVVGFRRAAGVPPVEPPLVDVLDDAVRHEVPDRLAPADPVAAVGRADRQRRHLHQADPAFGQVRVGEVVARPGHADEVRQVEQLLVVPPGDDLGERVGAGDEEQLGVRVAAAAVPQRVDGVGGPARSMSMRLTENCGFDAVAMTVIR